MIKGLTIGRGVEEKSSWSAVEAVCKHKADGCVAEAMAARARLPSSAYSLASTDHSPPGPGLGRNA